MSVHTVKVYRGVEVWLHYLLTSALDGGDSLGSGTGRFTLGRHRSPLNGRLRGLQSLPGLPGEEEYFLFLPGLETRTVQAVTQLCYNNTCTSRLIVSRPSRHLVTCGQLWVTRCAKIIPIYWLSEM